MQACVCDARTLKSPLNEVDGITTSARAMSDQAIRNQHSSSLSRNFARNFRKSEVDLREIRNCPLAQPWLSSVLGLSGHVPFLPGRPLRCALVRPSVGPGPGCWERKEVMKMLFDEVGIFTDLI